MDDVIHDLLTFIFEFILAIAHCSVFLLHLSSSSSTMVGTEKMTRGSERRATRTSKGLVVLVVCFFVCFMQFRHELLSPPPQIMIDAPRESSPKRNIIKPRIFLPITNNPCIVEDYPSFQSTEPSNDGLLFVKIKKSGSSTLAGVAARIAHAMSPINGAVCKSRMTHEWSQTIHGGFRERNRDKSLLWTILRDPAQRAISDFYFEQVGRNGVDPVQALSNLRKVRNFELKSISNAKAPGYYIIERVLRELDFIGILERLDESLVVLQLLLGLKTSDILYLNAKQSGGFDHHNNCSSIPKAVVTPEVKDYLSSDEWKENNKADYLLYDLVNQSMDMTIQYIGRSKFEKALKIFSQAKALVDLHCEYKSPCIREGVERPRLESGAECYARDWGCGYKCIDQLF